jgi:hypothetical protein
MGLNSSFLQTVRWQQKHPLTQSEVQMFLRTYVYFRELSRRVQGNFPKVSPYLTTLLTSQNCAWIELYIKGLQIIRRPHMVSETVP